MSPSGGIGRRKLPLSPARILPSSVVLLCNLCGAAGADVEDMFAFWPELAVTCRLDCADSCVRCYFSEFWLYVD